MNRPHISVKTEKELWNMVSILFKPKTLLLPIAAGCFTYWCYSKGIAMSFSEVIRFFFIGLFFCFGVLINTADQRRLQAFASIAKMKSILMTFWEITLSKKLPEKKKNEVKNIIEGIIPRVKIFLRKEDSHLSSESFYQVDKGIFQLTKVVEILRKHGVA